MGGMEACDRRPGAWTGTAVGCAAPLLWPKWSGGSALGTMLPKEACRVMAAGMEAAERSMLGAGCLGDLGCA